MVHEMNSRQIHGLLYSELKGDAIMSFVSDFESAIEYIEENLTSDFVLKYGYDKEKIQCLRRDDI